MYLAEIKNDFPDLAGALDTHLIMPDLADGVFDNDFFAFLADRSQRIFEVITSETAKAADAAVAPFLKSATETGSPAEEAQDEAET